MTLDPSTRRNYSVAAMLFVVATGAIPVHAVAQVPAPPPVPTHIVSYTAPVFPDASGDFEHTGITRHQYAPTWAPWTMSPQVTNGGVVSGAGIAKDGAPLLAQSSAAPQGDYVCFLQGTGYAECNVQFAPGIWKLRFSAAQRVQGTTPDQQTLRVTIAGNTVFEQLLPDGTFAEYVTSTVVVNTTTSLLVRFAGLQGATNANIALVDHILLDREFPWSAGSTWGAAGVPGTNAKVRILAGAEVVMDTTCVAESVEVQGGLLRAGTVNASLETMWVLVHTAGAQFRVGTEAAPFQQDFTLSLIGPPSAQDIMGGGTKFLMAMDGGVIDMHGKERRTWSKLTSVVGNVIRVADAVEWGSNDRIVVTRTAWMPNDASVTDPVQSEERAITGYNPVNGDITLASALTYPHCSAAPSVYTRTIGSVSKTWKLDQRAEVGLLTHNVRVQARNDTDATVGKFGGHVMLMNCPMCNTPGSGRFSHVQFQRMGQEQRFGRYPLHWHMQLANGQGQYASGCSIWQSYNRAIVIHGSDYVTIEDNVCYDHVGHGIFLEDGGERHNRFLRNLVVRTTKPTQQLALLPHDASHNEPQNRSPAAFWITNPENEFVGNVVADTVGTAYWFALHQHPFNQSADLVFTNNYFAPGGVPLNSTTLPLGAFRDNVAHAVKTAIDLNDSVDPHSMTLPLQHDDTLVPNVPWLPSQPALLERFVAHGCATALYSGTAAEPWEVDDVNFVDAVLADNEWHVQFACAFGVSESLFVAQSNNSIFAPVHQAFTGVAYVPYDGPGRVTKCHWVGFHGTTQLSPLAVSTVFGAAQRQTNHLLEGITKPPGSPAFRIESLFDFNTTATWPPPSNPTIPSLADSRSWGIAISNPDGSIVGTPGLTLVTDHPMMRMSSGPHADFAYPQSTGLFWPMHCSWYRWGYLRLQHFEANGTQLYGPQQPTMTFTRPLHDTCPPVTFNSWFQVDAHRQLPVIVRRAADLTSAECWYVVSWQPPANAKELRVSTQNIAAGDVTTLRFQKTDGWTGESVWVGGVQLTPVANPHGLTGLPTTAYARTGTNDLYLRVVNTASADKVSIRWQ